MCGLVAVISKMGYGFHKEQVDAFDNLLYIDALRGMDSTGVFMVDKEGNMDMAKEASAAHDFRNTPEFQAMKTKAIQKGVALIGHNRSATRGTITDENAHPFVVDDRITLVHNGTLFGNHKLLADTEVDSHAIAHTIHNKGDDVEAALQELSGAYALMWHDFKNKTINMVRNSQRPLHFVETDNAWYWASEANMLYWILARYSMKTLGDIASLKEGTLVTYTQGKDNKFTVGLKDLTLVKPTSVYTAGWSGVHSRTPVWEGMDDDEYDEYYMSRRVKRNALANGYHDLEEKSNVLELPAPKAASRIHPTPHDVMQTTIEEEKMALLCDISFNFQRFNHLASNIPTNSWQYGLFFEYIEVIKHNPAAGYYLYAALEDEPDFIVKVYIPGTTPENYILDLCVNKKRAHFHMTSSIFRSYTGKQKELGAGYGIFNSDKFTVIESTVSNV